MKNQFQALQRYLRTKRPTAFAFLSENQKRYDTADPMKLELTFDTMLISEHPGMVCLKNKYGSLCLSQVKSVRYIENKSILGTIITIVCNNPNETEGEIHYTVIAD